MKTHTIRQERPFNKGFSRKRTFISCLTMLTSFLLICASAQQIGDTSFKPPIENPAYPLNSGPVVIVDEAHFNFHTSEGRYKPFAELLRRDGYVVKPQRLPFSKESLNSGHILVISNALNERNKENWSLPTPSAFTDGEIEAVGAWVKEGGSLLLIADHMPFPGAAEKLVASLGARFTNGHVYYDEKRSAIQFQRAGGSLVNHSIPNGRTISERVDSVTTFGGSAFQADQEFHPLLILGSPAISVIPKTASQFTDETPRIPVPGWFQGAVRRFGQGRVAIFGEAAMFTAQLAGPKKRPMGMNNPLAKENYKFILNLFHWLSGLLD